MLISIFGESKSVWVAGGHGPLIMPKVDSLNFKKKAEKASDAASVVLRSSLRKPRQRAEQKCAKSQVTPAGPLTPMKSSNRQVFEAIFSEIIEENRNIVKYLVDMSSFLTIEIIALLSIRQFLVDSRLTIS